MDFEQVVSAVLQGLEREQIRYGVIGGVALGALGIVRATIDLDFLVHRDDLERLDRVLAQLGYARHARMENVSHYRHTQHAWGSIDILHAFRAFSLAMLERATVHPVFNGTQQIRVLQPEDIIGLKVQALANDPIRRAQETADIEAIMAVHGKRLDWNRIQEYYDLFELTEDARRLKERCGDAQ